MTSSFQSTAHKIYVANPRAQAIIFPAGTVRGGHSPTCKPYEAFGPTLKILLFHFGFNRSTFCCPAGLTILSQLQFRLLVPLAMMHALSLLSDNGRHQQTITHDHHSLFIPSPECPLHSSWAMLPLYWAPQVAYSCVTSK